MVGIHHDPGAFASTLLYYQVSVTIRGAYPVVGYAYDPNHSVFQSDRGTAYPNPQLAHQEINAVKGLKHPLPIGLCLLVSVAIGLPISTYAQPIIPSSYRYAFATDAGIGFLDPARPEQAPIWYSITPPDSDKAFVSFTRATASPDGRWIALSITQRSSLTMKIQLFNVALDKAQPPIQVGNGFPSEWEIMGWFGWGASAQEMLWSPDSRYLALNMIDKTQSDIYLYSVNDGTLTDILALDIAQHYYIAWSNDSRRIATYSTGCASDGQCASWLKTFDVQGNLVDSTTVSDISCELGWSPNDRYVYFENTCNGMSWDQRELYLWDTVQNATWRITNFTTPFQTGDRAIPGAIHHVLWTTPHTMLISAIIVDSKTGSAYTRTVSYDTDSRTLIALSDDLIQEWSINPVSGQIVFRRIAQADFDLYEPRNPTVRLGQISNGSLTEVPFPQTSQINGGCDLAWSPDGKYLAYEFPQSCTQSYATGVGFMDNTTGIVRQHPFTTTDQPPISEAIAAGWVVTPGQAVMIFPAKKM